MAVGIPTCSGSRPAEEPLPGLSKSKTRKAEGRPAHGHPPHEHLGATSSMLVSDALGHQCQPVGCSPPLWGPTSMELSPELNIRP